MWAQGNERMITVMQINKERSKSNVIVAAAAWLGGAGIRLFTILVFNAVFLFEFIGLQAPIAGEFAGTMEGSALHKKVEKILEDYLRNRPELIEQALMSLQTKRQAEEKQRVKAAIAARLDLLVKDPSSPVSGNPKADVPVVAFFDYRCGYCRKVAAAVTQLQKNDANVRLIYKDLPILGEDSVFAAKAALAAHVQGKHHAFHEALYAAKSDLTSAQIMKIASQVGLDARKLAADMKDPRLDAILARNHAVAKDLGINGTPTFVIGDELVTGAIELGAFKDIVARARAESECSRISCPLKGTPQRKGGVHDEL